MKPCLTHCHGVVIAPSGQKCELQHVLMEANWGNYCIASCILYEYFNRGGAADKSVNGRVARVMDCMPNWDRFKILCGHNYLFFFFLLFLTTYLKFNLINYFKRRPNVSAYSASVYWKMDWKDWEKARGIMEWIMSTPQKYVCTLSTTQRLRKKKKNVPPFSNAHILWLVTCLLCGSWNEVGEILLNPDSPG